MEGRINLELTKAEAMLLFESILKLERREILDTMVTDAEKYVFAYLASSLEKALPVQTGKYSGLLLTAEQKIQKHLAHSSIGACRKSLLSDDDID